jgi:hypothetical protein
MKCLDCVGTSTAALLDKVSSCGFVTCWCCGQKFTDVADMVTWRVL